MSVAAVPVVAAFPAAAAEPTPHEASFDDHADDFFREGEAAPAMATLELDDERANGAGRDPAIAAAAARRRAFSRHVLGVVALSVLVCVAAFVRSVVGSPSAAAAETANPASSPTSIAVVAVAEPPRVAPSPIAPAATTTAPTAAPQVAPPEVAVAAAPEVAVAVAPEVSRAGARAAREDARRALERGAAAAAIAAGMQSVELDPTDADAWLVLGAAYQLAGKGAEARSAFYSCAKLAKRGDIGECRALVP